MNPDTKQTGTTLVVIDLQNDYFPDGAFPLWDTDRTLAATLEAIGRAREAGMPVILVQHVADSARGASPFFNAGTRGVELHPDVLRAAGGARVVVKAHADAFLETELEEALQESGTRELLICGMMTQNCVTHTAISRAADKYRVAVLADCCATVSDMLHRIALNALGDRVRVTTSVEAF